MCLSALNVEIVDYPPSTSSCVPSCLLSIFLVSLSGRIVERRIANVDCAISELNILLHPGLIIVPGQGSRSSKPLPSYEQSVCRFAYLRPSPYVSRTRIQSVPGSLVLISILPYTTFSQVLTRLDAIDRGGAYARIRGIFGKAVSGSTDSQRAPCV